MLRNAVLMALVLLLALGAGGQPVSAQAGDPEVKVQSQMEASTLPSICVGEQRALKVWVTRTLTEIATKWKVPRHLPGVQIIGTVADASIASLTLPVQTTGFASNLPGEARFEIQGHKIGATTINFSAPLIRLPGEVLINNARSDVNYVDLTVTVNVIACDFDFTAHSDFTSTGMEVHATINRVTLTPDAQGQINRSVTVHWTGSWVDTPFCTHTFAAGDTTAALTGEVDQSGNLVLYVAYEKSTGIWNTDCGGPIKSPDPITLNPETPQRLDIAVAGGLYDRTRPQNLEELAGEVTYVVAPQHQGGTQ